MTCDVKASITIILYYKLRNTSCNTLLPAWVLHSIEYDADSKIKFDNAVDYS